jgi:hypothetical protein
VRERDYFFIVSFSVWGLWAGMGIAALWREVAHELRVGLTAASPVLLLAFIPLVFNWSWATRAYDYSARDWGYNLLMSVEPYGVLFTNGDNDTFPLWYIQEVEGTRRDVTVIVTSYLNTEWYTKQLKALTAPCPPGTDPSSDWSRIQCQRPYTGENTGAVYTTDPGSVGDRIPLPLAAPVRAPTKSIIPLDDATIDRVAMSYAEVPETRVLQLGNVRATIQGGRYLMPWEQYALTLINHVIDERPIYFASSGNAASLLGVNEYLVRQGLAFRLHNGAIPETLPPGTVSMPEGRYTPVTGRWVDIPRTSTLVDEVFMHRSDLPDGWGHWPDHATIGIPNYYAWAYMALLQAAILANDEEGITRYQDRAEAWTILGSGS